MDTWGKIIILSPLAGVVINLLLIAYEHWKSRNGEKEESHSNHTEENHELTPIKKISGSISSLAIFLSFVGSLLIFRGENFSLELMTWLPLESVKISISALYDELSKTALLYITGVSTLIHIYSIGYMAHDRGFIRYFMLLNLFVFFMIQIVVSDNLLQIFLGWEGVGLCSYLLIGFWYSVFENARAGFKAFITNRIGDFGFIVGIALVLYYTGNMNYSVLKSIPVDKVFIVAFFLFMGAMGKSAQGPLWLWLPDAMRGPTPVSALIHAATMVTAGVYMTVRLKEIFLTPSPSELVFWIGIITCLLMGFFGLFERDIKRILAFSTLSQLGLMFCGAVSHQPYTGIFHVFEHSFFKAALFLISGILMHAFADTTDIYKLRENKPSERGMMLSAFGFLIASLAMSGVFPLSGFWSKESIILAVSEKFGEIGALLMLLASFITPLYMFRVFFIVFGGQRFKLSFSPSLEGGSLMFFPVLILVILSVVGGIFNVGVWLGEEYGYGYHPRAHHTLANPVLIHIVVFAAIAIAYLVFSKGREPREEGLRKILWKKLYLNEAEEWIIIGSAIALVKLIYSFLEMLIIEGLYSLVALISKAVGSLIALLHGGSPTRVVILLILAILLAVILL